MTGIPVVVMVVWPTFIHVKSITLREELTMDWITYVTLGIERVGFHHFEHHLVHHQVGRDRLRVRAAVPAGRAVRAREARDDDLEHVEEAEHGGARARELWIR